MDRRLVWLGAGAFAVSTVGFVFSGLLPFIAEDARISIAHAGLLITVYAMSYAIFTPLLSAFAGSMDRRFIITGALVGFIAGNLLAAASQGFETLLAAQILMGMSAGLYAATAQATAVALASPDHRARAIATVVGGTTLAVAIGAPAGSAIATLWGWRSAFLAIALLAAVAAVILWFQLPRGSRGAKMTLIDRLTVIRHPGVFAALSVTFFYLSGAFVVISYLAPLALEGAGLGHAALPAMLLAFGFGAVIGNLSSGQLSDRIGPTRVVTISILFSMTMCVAISLALKLLPHHISGPVLIGLMVPWGIVGWTFPPAQASRLVGLGPELAHLTMGLNMSAMYFGIGFGTFVGGRMLEVAKPSDLGLVGAIFPLAALAILAAGRRSKALTAAT